MNDENPFVDIGNQTTLSKPLMKAAKLTDEQLKSLAANLNQDDFDQILWYASLKIGRFDVQREVVIGGLLTLVRTAAQSDTRMEAYHAMIDKLGISTTKAYDSMAIFSNFGKVLLKEEELYSFLPIGSLKLLSKKSVTEETRQKAIQMARQGRRVKIEDAKLLVGILPSDDEQSSEPIELEEFVAPAKTEEVPKSNDALLVKPDLPRILPAKPTSEPSTTEKPKPKATVATPAKPKPTTCTLWTFHPTDAISLVIQSKDDFPVEKISIPDLLEDALSQYLQEAGLSFQTRSATPSTITCEEDS